MNRSPSAALVRALGLAMFQRDASGALRLAGPAPEWLLALWPKAARSRGVLRPRVSPFLENFLVDAAACWRAGGARRARSGLWLERDACGREHQLEATALTVGGRATLLISKSDTAYAERRALVQKAHKLALAHEKLQQTEQALAEEKRLLETRVCERTGELSRANAALKAEIATRRRFAERLEVVHKIDKAILAARSPEAIAHAALRRLHQVLPCDQANVVILDPGQPRATILASVSDRKVTRGGAWQLSDAQLRECRILKSGQLQQIRHRANLFAPPSGGKRDRARVWPLIVDIPLMVESRLVGVLNLATDSPGAFTAEQEEIALEVATQLALALRQARLFAAVAGGREQLRALSLRLVEVQEAERRFLAHELHDEIGQVLTGLKLTLEMLVRPAGGAAEATVTEAIEMVDELMQRARQLSLDLRPQMLDDLGLVPALEWHCKRFGQKTGIRVRFQHAPPARRWPTHLETAVFRTVQEALTNVARHARATEATVRLWSDRRRLRVQVEDRGVGFDVALALADRSSSGLSGMRERATLLGGEFTLNSTRDQGTRLTVELPLRPAKSRPQSGRAS